MAALAVTSGSANFLFATCNPGWESALKADMRTHHGETITPAFLQPELVTWKVTGGMAEQRKLPIPVLAHVPGSSLGMAKTLEELPEIAAFLERVRKPTPGEANATQLPSNRKEITILSLPERRQETNTTHLQDSGNSTQARSPTAFRQ